MPQARRRRAEPGIDCGDVYAGNSCGQDQAGWACPPEGGCPGGDCTGEWEARRQTVALMGPSRWYGFATL